MGEVLSITFVGIVIVFLVLAILSLFFILFKYISSTEKKVKKEINIPHTNPAPLNSNTTKNEDNDEEIIAAIMGAIAATMGSKTYRIKNIKPINNINKTSKMSMWGMLPPAVTWRARRLGGRK
ncbi:OadG family protein [Marinitoga sp. 38H-ov]|uniref:OadG family protein n=1 Tax=Marinitoga sp. 38H-ov TaxID=1755814 RepID=UPI0013EA8603|nr:OadG family protein [Marinitoga sp. 38H-ov]KAF2956097.1 hypothetical protein AS160_08010 [Marinitoga sp. 38H-ov]